MFAGIFANMTSLTNGGRHLTMPSLGPPSQKLCELRTPPDKNSHQELIAWDLVILFLKAWPKEDAEGIKQDRRTKLFRVSLKNQVKNIFLRGRVK